MDVPVICLGAKYQNLWENKEDKICHINNNVEFFLHGEAMRDVIWWSHRIRAVTIQRYAAFINFQASVHNIIMDPSKDPTKQVHQAGFMITDANVDAIVQHWLT